MFVVPAYEIMIFIKTLWIVSIILNNQIYYNNQTFVELFFLPYIMFLNGRHIFKKF